MTLRQLFDKLHLNQTFYADLMGISKGYLSDMLNERRKFNKESALRTHLRNHATEINNFLEETS